MSTAKDAMGSAARIAADAAGPLCFYLNGAAVESLARELRGANVERAFRVWYPLVRAMSALERAAPNAARRALEEDQRIQDFAHKGAA